MGARRIVTVVLLLFVLASVIALIAGGRGGGERAPQGPAAPDGPECPDNADQAAAGTPAAETVIAYYFHGDRRCRTCRAIESYSQEALLCAFPEELKNGRLRWAEVNFDDPANEHFIRDFGLTASSLVLVRRAGGAQAAWKTLDRVWRLAGDKEAFAAYVRDETAAYLRGGT